MPTPIKTKQTFGGTDIAQIKPPPTEDAPRR